MTTLQNWLDAYGESHQNKTNKIIHWICVPVIFFSGIGLLASIPHGFILDLFVGVNEGVVPYVHFGTLVIILALIFYVRLAVVMALGILCYCVLCLVGILFY
jgi:uncharacterized membrane protein YGL010W